MQIRGRYPSAQSTPQAPAPHRQSSGRLARPILVGGAGLHVVSPGDVLHLQRTIGNQAVAKLVTQASPMVVVQRHKIGGIEVDKGGGMPSWEHGGVKYHLNMTTDPPHVTQEGRSKGKKANITKTHFFFTAELNGQGQWEFKNAIGSGGVAGSKKKFFQLPSEVSSFVQTNYEALIH